MHKLKENDMEPLTLSTAMIADMWLNARKYFWIHGILYLFVYI